MHKTVRGIDEEISVATHYLGGAFDTRTAGGGRRNDLSRIIVEDDCVGRSSDGCHNDSARNRNGITVDAIEHGRRAVAVARFLMLEILDHSRHVTRASTSHSVHYNGAVRRRRQLGAHDLTFDRKLWHLYEQKGKDKRSHFSVQHNYRLLWYWQTSSNLATAVKSFLNQHKKRQNKRRRQGGHKTMTSKIEDEIRSSVTQVSFFEQRISWRTATRMSIKLLTFLMFQTCLFFPRFNSIYDNSLSTRNKFLQGNSFFFSLSFCLVCWISIDMCNASTQVFRSIWNHDGRRHTFPKI